MRSMIVCIGMLAVGALLASCESATEDGDAPVDHDENASDTAGDDQQTADRDDDDATSSEESAEYAGPPVEVELEVRETAPPQHVAAYSVYTRTGGYVVTLDRAELDEESKALTLYLTIEQPARDEIVTQALVTHRGTHNAGAQPVERIDVLARVLTRNRPNDDAQHLPAARWEASSEE